MHFVKLCSFIFKERERNCVSQCHVAFLLSGINLSLATVDQQEIIILKITQLGDKILAKVAIILIRCSLTINKLNEQMMMSLLPLNSHKIKLFDGI